MRHAYVETKAQDPTDDRIQGDEWNADHVLAADENFVTDAELLVLADAVTSSAVIADHAIVRGDGGAKGVQDSGVLIDDNDLVFVPGTDSDFTTGLHVVDVAGQLGAYHTNYGIESYSTDANGAWAASDGDLYFNYYSSGDIFFGDGGGDLFSSGDFWLTTTGKTFYFGSSAYKLQIDGSNNLSFTDAVTGTKTLAELANNIMPAIAEPADPALNTAVPWMSNGTGTGTNGDILIKINVGGVVKTATLVPYSLIT